MVYLQGGPSSGTPGGGVTVLAEEPQHGRLVVVPGEQGALPYAESHVLAQLGAGEDPAPTAPDAEHAVPGKVQTGDEAAWWAVGLGALGAGALVAARRRFGLGEAR
ncbi:hypothetical protein KW076_08835 [Micrococcus porci]|uniref:hypothetical protein n=1 Tax=Micrococcus porci TaxID=2856555 RepID=UPI001CCC8672|nr:hypothetical protein [Micrococcus porci]UBH23995.1 hypothetical protein KW076_08835 [Micrococcus porci]